MSLDDVGLGPTFFNAALGHMTGRVSLPGTDAADRPVSPEDPTIVHEECLRDPRNWRITQVRFAPYEMEVPGTISAYQTWASARGSRLDRAMQLRLSVHPFCANDVDPARIEREDQAMHLVYAIAPEDASLAASVVDSAKAFTAAQLAGTRASRDASYVELDKHRAALASPEWASFRKTVLSDWARLARTTTLATDGFAPLDTHAASFRTNLLSSFADRFTNPEPSVEPSVAHPGLVHPESPLRLALKPLVQKYGRPERLKRVALMFTVGTQDPLDDFQQTRWFFSQIVPGRYARLAELPADAAAVYGSFSPASLDTFVAVDNTHGVDVIRATAAGFYSESRGALTGPKAVHPPRVNLGGRNVDIKREVDKVDYEQAVTLDPDSVDMPKLPEGPSLKAAMERFTNIEVTNATTTGCDRCHNMQNFLRTGSATGYRASPREQSAYNFHMVTASTLSLRTVRELDAELVKAREELGSR